jgi:predicted SnoaL-like aldol condensation-catalyzing enzyme
MSSMDAATNAQTVREFVQTAFIEGRAQDAVDSFIGDRYVQHNPDVPDGIEGFKGIVAETKDKYPNFIFDTRKVIADDDHVCLHSYLSYDGNPPGISVMDIFRLEDGKIVEHWDVLQPIPEKQAHGNGMF